MENKLEGNQGRRVVRSFEMTEIIQARDDGRLEQGCSVGGAEMWSKIDNKRIS